MKLFLFGCALGVLTALAAQRFWRWLTSAPTLSGPEGERDERQHDALPAARPHPPVVTYCPWCVRAHQLADPAWEPEGVPVVCWLHGTGSVLSRRQARAILDELRRRQRLAGGAGTSGAGAGSSGEGPFALDELQPWPQRTHVTNAAN